MSETPHPTPTGRAGIHPIMQGAVSGLLLWLAFPPASWTWLAWVALVPILLLVISKRSRWSIYLGAWLGGVVFWLLALNWILCIDATASLAWAAMAVALSLFWPIKLALMRLAVLRLRLPLMIAGPIIWTTFEYVRAYFLTGFPWYYLAHSQYRQIPLIQIADLTGSLGLSFLIMLANGFVTDLLSLPIFEPSTSGPKLARPVVIRASVMGLALACTLVYGFVRIGTANFEPGPTVGLIQTNFMQRYGAGRTAEKILLEFETLILRAAKSDPKPDLLIWPETSYPYGYVTIEPNLPSATIEKQGKSIYPNTDLDFWMTKHQNVDRQLHEWVDALGISMMVGSTTYDFRETGQRRYNSAILFEPRTPTIQSYHKLHLVPFGEYVPLIQAFPWLVALTPYRNGHIPSLAFGGVPSWFSHGKYRYAAAICFEDTIPQVVRRLFSEVPDGKSPDVLLNLSNDGWFVWEGEGEGEDQATAGSSEQEMHLASSVFRAVEHRAPLARAANTGISAVIDGNGRVVASLPTAKGDALVANVPLDPRTGLYTVWGDWVGLGCLAITIGFVPLGLSRRRGHRPLKSTSTEQVA